VSRSAARCRDDFSLNQTLSLYLPRRSWLDRDAETYALDVLTLVESDLENPDAVLRKQLDKLKTERMDQMKARHRVRDSDLATDAMEWPKPLRDLIYETFNAFADRPPGSVRQHPAPVDRARNSETNASFGRLRARSTACSAARALLLRYLSQAYKASSRTCRGGRARGVLDLLAQMRSRCARSNSNS